MARTRRKVESTDSAETTPGVEIKTNKERTVMGLSNEQIKAIYANRRVKGLYDKKLVEFLGSGEAGVSVREIWPDDFAYHEKLEDDKTTGKKAASIKQGFENSRGRKEAPAGSENVDVIVDGEEVFLINKDVAGMVAESTEDIEAELAEVTA